MEFVTASGQSVPVEIQRRKGTRHLRLRLGKHNQIVASAPWHSGDRSVEKFIQQQRDWLENQLAKAPAVVSLREWLQANPRISASGDILTARIVVKVAPRANYCFVGGGSEVIFYLPQSDEASLRKLVRAFARDTLTCRVYFHAKRLGLLLNQLSVRDQSSRWGSCSARRGLSLNWRLVLLTPELQDYVILHELAHLTEMNHGPQFWRLLDCYDPERVSHEAELDRVSAEFMRVARV